MLGRDDSANSRRFLFAKLAKVPTLKICQKCPINLLKLSLFQKKNFFLDPVVCYMCWIK